MKVEIDKAQVKKIEVSILDYIVQICNENDLKYLLCYGTLLGAIRHKGFIPWDDDIDICMPREDYNKLIEICESRPDSRYKMFTKDTDPSYYYYDFAKVVDRNTEVIEHDLLPNPNMGVWVDIFPLDGAPTPRTKRLILFLRKSRIFAVLTNRPREHKLKGVFVSIYWFICQKLKYKRFLDMSEKICIKEKYSESEKVGFIPIPVDNYLFDRSVFEEVIEVEFEGKKYLAPKQYDLYLTQVYGDYMQVPPENERITHSFTAYWK